MIGIAFNPNDRPVVEEFFQLFKVPWEPFRRAQQYDAVICCSDLMVEESETKLVIQYSGRECHFDRERARKLCLHAGGRFVCNEVQLPIYGDAVTFEDLAVQSSRLVVREKSTPQVEIVRIGYDLFQEVRTLLTSGQPIANALVPTLDLHIAILRDLLVEGGVALTEIPPVPEGYKFIACLTHDVDHPSLRSHGFDHTSLGFLYRATLGTLKKFLQGRMTLGDLFANWLAGIKLPFVQAGLARDFWCDFSARYRRLERGLPSTFFVIPFKGRAGKTADGVAPAFRAAKYGAHDLSDILREIQSSGGEIGLHGIDVWLDPQKGQEELGEIRRLTGKNEIGVRTHWLYYNQQSPATLEQAGASYDSTIGYNETVGYRAGTCQAYKPLEAPSLMELPLHIMDTALFFPSYLNLSPKDAKQRVRRILDHAERHGGCVTINWHDRSLAPERQWGAFYQELVQELQDRGAWFGTASEVVGWFRKRRAAQFHGEQVGADASTRAATLPGLQLRVQKKGQAAQEAALDAVAS